MEKILKIGIIGCGGIANGKHMPNLAKLDDKGRVYISGRIKNVIVTENGKNIYPEELETRLSEYPEIGEALVFASEENGETFVKAKIFPNIEYIKERFGGEKPSEEDIKKTIQNAMSGFLLLPI